MEIQALTPAHGEAFMEFFDQRAFSDNPYWKGCYCTFFHRPEHIGPEQPVVRPTRRVQAETMIREGTLRGYLAYGKDGRVIGWCNANRRSAFLRLGPGEADVVAVVCFVIDPAHRRRGVARALLARVLEDAAREGVRAVEAYPSSRARTASGHYHGPLALYESFGFQRVPGRKLVVRKELPGGGHPTGECDQGTEEDIRGTVFQGSG